MLLIFLKNGTFGVRDNTLKRTLRCLEHQLRMKLAVFRQVTINFLENNLFIHFVHPRAQRGKSG